jgi:glycosyltransferase involved in cell wall biosynthesis
MRSTPRLASRSHSTPPSARERRLRILYAHCFYRIPGGEDRHVRDQVDLVSASHDVELVSEANVDLSDSPATAARMLYSRSEKQHLGRIIDRFKPDVVHVHNTYPSLGPAVVLAANDRGIPVVMTVHNFRLRCPNGLMFTEGTACRRCESGAYINALMHQCFPSRKQAGAYAVSLWAHRFAFRLQSRMARFIAPSEFMQRRMLEWGIGKDRVRLIRHFVKSSGGAESGTVGSYGAFVGRLSEEKGLTHLLAALHRAGDPDFVVVGDGPQRWVLEGLARQYGLANTRFVGWVSHEQVGDLVAAARFVAIPSIGEETASLAALEALSAGRPLLVSDRGALPELVASGGGVAFRSGDEIDLAEKLSLLMKDDELCDRASSEASSFARRWLAPHRHLAGLEAVYRELSGNGVT